MTGFWVPLEDDAVFHTERTLVTPHECIALAFSLAVSYAHDGLGRRVKSVLGPSNPVTNVYVCAGLSVIYETNPETAYVHAAGMRLAKLVKSG